MFDWLFKKKTSITATPRSNTVTRIVVTLPADRTQFAKVEAFSSTDQQLGYWVGMCKADAGAARAAGNPTCDWRRKFGETPTGEYELSEIRKPANSEEQALFGSGEYLVLSPLSGNAAIAEAQGRTVLLIHGGKASPTDGSIRLPDRAVVELISLLTRNTLPVRVSVVEYAQAINQAQAEEIADDYDWQYSTNNSPSLFSLYCQYYMWDSLLSSSQNNNQNNVFYDSNQTPPDDGFYGSNQTQPSLTQNDPTVDQSVGDPAALALAGVQVLPDSVTNSPVQLEAPDPTTQSPIELERPDPAPIELERPDPVTTNGDTTDNSNAYGR